LAVDALDAEGMPEMYRFPARAYGHIPASLCIDRTDFRDIARPCALSWQLAIVFFWSPTFFSLHVIGMALGIIGLMLLTIVGFIPSAFTRDRLAAALFVPYAAWVSFALALNAAICRLN
jgi:tryptophan-rich sensory protein